MLTPRALVVTRLLSSGICLDTVLGEIQLNFENLRIEFLLVVI
jgi:hypothetical protein